MTTKEVQPCECSLCRVSRGLSDDELDSLREIEKRRADFANFDMFFVACAFTATANKLGYKFSLPPWPYSHPVIVTIPAKDNGVGNDAHEAFMQFVIDELNSYDEIAKMRIHDAILSTGKMIRIDRIRKAELTT